MSQWMKEWGQFIVLLVALGGVYIGLGRSLRGEMNRMEDRLTGQILANQEAIETNQRAIESLGREVSELRGELKGRDLIGGTE